MKPQTLKERAEEDLAYTKTLRFQLYMLGVETRRFFHVFASEWRLYDFVGWLNEKLERRPLRRAARRAADEGRKQISTSSGFVGVIKKDTQVCVHRGELVEIKPKEKDDAV